MIQKDNRREIEVVEFDSRPSTEKFIIAFTYTLGLLYAACWSFSITSWYWMFLFQTLLALILYVVGDAIRDVFEFISASVEQFMEDGTERVRHAMWEAFKALVTFRCLRRA